MPYDDTPRDYKIIVKVDSEQRILEYNCPEFIDDLDGWAETSKVLCGTIGHAHQQIVTLTKNATNEQGILLYKLVDRLSVERAPEEIAADLAAIPPPPLTETELLKAQVQALTERGEFLEDVIAELAMMTL
jgi:hypothetical protein